MIGSVLKNIKRITAAAIIEAFEEQYVAQVITTGLIEGGSSFQVNSVFAHQVQAVVESAVSAAIEAENRYHNQ